MQESETSLAIADKKEKQDGLLYSKNKSSMTYYWIVQSLPTTYIPFHSQEWIKVGEIKKKSALRECFKDLKKTHKLDRACFLICNPSIEEDVHIHNPGDIPFRRVEKWIDFRFVDKFNTLFLHECQILQLLSDCAPKIYKLSKEKKFLVHYRRSLLTIFMQGIFFKNPSSPILDVCPDKKIRDRNKKKHGDTVLSGVSDPIYSSCCFNNLSVIEEDKGKYNLYINPHKSCSFLSTCPEEESLNVFIKGKMMEKLQSLFQVTIITKLKIPIATPNINDTL